MVCSNCGTENKAGRKFCAACAAPLAVVCPACGAANEPGDRFCGECASPLVPGVVPAPATQRPQVGAAVAPGASTPPGASAFPAGAAVPTAERRLVSVLFADLVGFTPFAEERDSEEVRETLTRYFEIASEVISRYGGIVEKFIGDAVMAVWGTPTAREDDAERSVRAALELVAAVRVLGPGIQARAGVMTGEAAVTIGATNQGMVAGDIVNTASRLQSAAAPGTVLVGESTQRAASKAIAFEPAGEQSLKGKTAPVPAFWALRVVAERGGRGRSDTLEAPFVGRDDELRLLKDLFHATVREGRTRLVSVTGLAGIGKSRLAWEFEKYLDGIVGRVWWHRGRSPAYGEGISFWALGEMIRARAGLAETDDEPTTRARIAALLDTLDLADTERHWIEPALLALLGVETGIHAEQLFGAWRTFFERLSASAPVVLVFEDLHWADAGTIDFIDHLLEWSRSIPLYIVTLARPELLERRADWGAGRRNFTSLYLEPLPEPAMRALLSGLVPGLPESAVRLVVARAEGIPLYAVESVRMLVADGQLAPAGDGTFLPVGDLTTLAIPETLTALIAARLDGLDPADRSLVLDAAVLGQSFAVPGLAAVSGVPEAELEARLRGLVRRELFAHETDPRSPERGQYAFVQALIREVAYNTLARKDRKTRHLAAARYFETVETDELASVLAGHYLAARDNATEGPEAEALGAQARVALRGAAERAAALGGHDQAVRFLDQALAVTTDPADRAELLERAGSEASLAGRHEIADGHLRAAVDLRRTLGDRTATAGAIAALGRARNFAFRLHEAAAVLKPAFAEFEDLAGEPAFMAIGAQLARSYFLDDDNRPAIEIADRVLEPAEHADLRALVADTLVTKGSALASIGRTTEGLGIIRAGQALAESIGLAQTVFRATNNLSATEGMIDPRATLERVRGALALARRLGARSWIGSYLQALGEGSIRTGEWSAALAELEPGLEDDWDPSDRMSILEPAIVISALRGRPAEVGMAELERLAEPGLGPAVLAVVPFVAAYVNLAHGRLAEARREWRRTADLYVANLPWAMAMGARAALWQRDPAAARADLAVLDASGFHGAAIETDRAMIRSGTAALEGRPAEALAGYREALRSWRTLGLAWDEALAGIDMATLLDPSEPEVRAAAEVARETFVRLEARPFVRRLDEALGRPPEAGEPLDGSRTAVRPSLASEDAAAT